MENAMPRSVGSRLAGQPSLSYADDLCSGLENLAKTSTDDKEEKTIIRQLSLPAIKEEPTQHCVTGGVVEKL